MNNIPYVKTFEYTKIVGVENIKFGKYILIDDFVFIYAKDEIKIGNYVHIGGHSSIIGGNKITIGNFIAISHGCRLFTASDDFKEWGFGNSTIDEKFRNLTKGDITLDDFAIIGANSVLLPGIHIGEGAAVAANSVVTRELNPWGVYIGNKRVKERDREGILRNYMQFEKNGLNERVGYFFKEA